MAVDLNSIPTSNTLNLAVTFLLNKKAVAELRYGQSETLDIRYDSIGVGNGEPLSIYLQETPGNFSIHPGKIAFVDRSLIENKIVLRYGVPDGVQNNIVYSLRSSTQEIVAPTQVNWIYVLIGIGLLIAALVLAL